MTGKLNKIHPHELDNLCCDSSTPKEPKEPEIPARLAGIGFGLGDLGKNIRVLIDRLDGLLAPASEDCSGSVTESDVTKLGSVLSDFGTKIYYANRAIQDILNRLQL